MLKVLHISTCDIAGGAAIAAYRLHRGLLSNGVDSIMLSNRKKSVDSSVFAFESTRSLYQQISFAIRGLRIKNDFRKYQKRRLPGDELFSDDRTRYGSEILRKLPDCDIINLHWISRFIDYNAFWGNHLKFPPIVWTLHDMNSFTGGCHYNFGCDKYMKGCGCCPQLHSSNQNDLSSRIWYRKKKMFGHLNKNKLHIVTPSKWLTNKAKKSRLLNRFECKTIHNGLNVDDFAPRDRRHSRKVLGIPLGARVIGFVAQSINNKRKGIKYLIEALRDCTDIKELYIVTIGKLSTQLNLNIPILQVGYLENDRLLSLVYSAADLFVIPSLQDNFPNTILESIACATPVVGFDSGGISEMIQPAKTGILVPVKDIGKLRYAIKDLMLNEQKRADIAANCRQTALNRFSPEIQAEAYLKLYESIKSL